MNNNIRLFTGLSIPESVRGALQQLLPGWKAAFPFERWSHPLDWHVTLHFIGDTDAGNVPDIRRAMEEAAEEIRPFPLAFDRLGLFGNPRRPSVFWVGLAGMLPQLHGLHAALGSALNRATGFVPEERSYQPHLTIARKYAGNGHLESSKLPALPSADHSFDWTAEAITLFQSHLGRSPMYDPILTVPLTTDRDMLRG